MSIKVS
jgi:hypothetical protein